MTPNPAKSETHQIGGQLATGAILLPPPSVASVAFIPSSGGSHLGPEARAGKCIPVCLPARNAVTDRIKHHQSILD